MDALPYVDALFKEYLLFRGFAKTLQTFNAELSADKGCGYQAAQISNLIFGRLIPQHDGSGLVELLDFLKTHVFSRLSSDVESRASKLELSILRLYVVYAIDLDKVEHVQQLFSAYGERFCKSSEAGEWEPWFALPFLHKPQADPRFQVYFTKPWRQLVEASFRNYMAKAVTQMPLPAVLRFNADRKQRQALQSRINALQAELERMKGREQLASQGSFDLNAAAASPHAARLETARSSSSLADLTPSTTSHSLAQRHRKGSENGGAFPFLLPYSW